MTPEQALSKLWAVVKKIFLFLPIIIGLSSGFFFGRRFFLDRTSNPQVLAQTTSDWPQLQHDVQHTGRTSAFVPPDYKLRWAWFDENNIVRDFVSQTDATIPHPSDLTVVFAGEVQPIVASGRVFFGSMNGDMYSVDALTGDTLWKYHTAGAIMHTAATANNIVVFGSMDGRVYALDVANGNLKWSYKTGAGVSAAPVIYNGVVYVGSRDGYFYAIDLQSGNLNWRYFTRVPGDSNSPFAGAPIVQPAAISANGIVFFGAENMHFYALNSQTGQEQWTPKKLIGQSFYFSWPVVADDLVMTFTQSSLEGAERLLEDEFDALADPNSGESRPDYAARVWPLERDVILTWLNNQPHQKTFYVLDINTGEEKYQVPMGRVSGNNYTPMPPVIDNLNRILVYWRTKSSTLLTGGTFGTKYTPDISEMDPLTGDRKWLPTPESGQMCELDNNFMLTVGGDYLYLNEHFRGSKVIDLVTGTNRGIAHFIACGDGAGWRGGEYDGRWGCQIIYYGNDSDPRGCGGKNADVVPPKVLESAVGESGIGIAETNGVTLLYINETNAGLIAAIEQK